MATSFDVLFLGNLALIDTNEGDQNVSTTAVNSWLGTYGGVTDPLSDTDSVRQFEPGSTGYAGGQLSNAYDINNNASNDTFLIDGTEKTHDATMVFNATLTYADGSSATVSAVLMQDTNGDVYLMPEMSYNADQMAFEAGPITSMTLNYPIYANGNTGQAYNLAADRYQADLVPCFTPGTLIATPQGEVAVETLQPGDKVFTRDNGIQEIRWIGRRDVAAQELAQRPSWQPILISAGALGANLPERDLLLSPNHRVLISGDRAALNFGETEVLAAAKYLTGFDGVMQVETGTVSYIHILFDRHEVILSNGAWSESFQPGDYSMRGIGDAQREEIFALFPELEQMNTQSEWKAARKVLKKHEAALLSA